MSRWIFTSYHKINELLENLDNLRASQEEKMAIQDEKLDNLLLLSSKLTPNNKYTTKNLRTYQATSYFPIYSKQPANFYVAPYKGDNNDRNGSSALI